MLVLEGTTIYEKGKPVGKLSLQEGQRSERFVIVESFMGGLKEVQLTEAEQKKLNTLAEANGKPNPKVLLTLEGVFQRADTVNANNRIYPNSIWKKVLEGDGKWMKAVQSGEMLGEADHPKDGETLLGRVACMVTDLRRGNEDDKVIEGRMVVFDTASGRNLKAIHDGGGRLGVSSRGQGSVVRMDGKDVVQEDYDLQTWDVVFNPSTPGAYPDEVTEKAAQESGQTLKEVTPMRGSFDFLEKEPELYTDKDGEPVDAPPAPKKESKPARPSKLDEVVAAAFDLKVPENADTLGSMKALREAYRAKFGVEGPLAAYESDGLLMVAKAMHTGSAVIGTGPFRAKLSLGKNLHERISTLEIRAASREELDKAIKERLSGVTSLVTVEIDQAEAIYEECATRFAKVVEAQTLKAQEAVDRAARCQAQITEMSAKLSAAKQLIEKFAVRTNLSESKVEDREATVHAAEAVIEGLRQEFHDEGLKAGIAAIAATHPEVEGLGEALSLVSSLSEAVQVTNKMKLEHTVVVDREPVGTVNAKVLEALKKSKEAESLVEQSGNQKKSESKELSSTKTVVDAVRKLGLK